MLQATKHIPISKPTEDMIKKQPKGALLFFHKKQRKLNSHKTNRELSNTDLGEYERTNFFHADCGWQYCGIWQPRDVAKLFADNQVSLQSHHQILTLTSEIQIINLTMENEQI